MMLVHTEAHYIADGRCAYNTLYCHGTSYLLKSTSVIGVQTLVDYEILSEEDAWEWLEEAIGKTMHCHG